MRLKVRRSKEEIQRILEKYPTTGLSKREFCNQYKLSEAVLYKWLKINKNQNNGNFIPVSINSDNKENKNLPTEIIKNRTCNDLSIHEIKIELLKGITIKIPLTSDPKWLSSFIRELQ